MQNTDAYFPYDFSQSNNIEVEKGMTVRDKLAESAMIGLLSGQYTFFNNEPIEVGTIAKESYRLADAMIKQSNL